MHDAPDKIGWQPIRSALALFLKFWWVSLCRNTKRQTADGSDRGEVYYRYGAPRPVEIRDPVAENKVKDEQVLGDNGAIARFDVTGGGWGRD